MKIYLVGGAVRDSLINRPFHEKDWVVVGATPQQLLDLGYKQVGKDFPVFLHPQTKEEYALARKERKIAPGYHGFEFDTSASVTLEEDLLRRDLTINAIAQASDGNIIDPYQGQVDLQQKILRHISPAFAEDPVRILRVARFAARFADFTIAPETNTLMKNMTQKGEADALVPERVWQEFLKALNDDHPERFFEALEECGALEKLFPEITLKSNAITALTHATKHSDSPEIRFAALTHPLSENELSSLNNRLKLPKSFNELSALVIKNQKFIQTNKTLSPQETLTLFEKSDAFRRPERFQLFLAACKAIKPDFEQCTQLTQQLESLRAIDAKKFVEQGLKGPEIAEAMRAERLKILSN